MGSHEILTNSRVPDRCGSLSEVSAALVGVAKIMTIWAYVPVGARLGTKVHKARREGTCLPRSPRRDHGCNYRMTKADELLRPNTLTKKVKRIETRDILLAPYHRDLLYLLQVVVQVRCISCVAKLGLSNSCR